MRARDLALDVLRIGVAVTTIVAMTYQFASTGERSAFATGNFFSFFTIQSNILAAAMSRSP